MAIHGHDLAQSLLDLGKTLADLKDKYDTEKELEEVTKAIATSVRAAPPFPTK